MINRNSWNYRWLKLLEKVICTFKAFNTNASENVWSGIRNNVPQHLRACEQELKRWHPIVDCRSLWIYWRKQDGVELYYERQFGDLKLLNIPSTLGMTAVKIVWPNSRRLLVEVEEESNELPNTLPLCLMPWWNVKIDNFTFHCLMKV